MKINKISFGAVKTQIAEPAGNKNKKTQNFHRIMIHLKGHTLPQKAEF